MPPATSRANHPVQTVTIIVGVKLTLIVRAIHRARSESKVKSKMKCGVKNARVCRAVGGGDVNEETMRSGKFMEIKIFIRNIDKYMQS